MHKFVFMLKTYIMDFNYVERLVETFNLYNEDSIPLFVVIPPEDYDSFKVFESKNIHIIFEDEFKGIDVFNEGCLGLSAGYLNQEIYKLAFWELSLCDNYCCIDSECYFIRNFHITDFMYQDTPYTVLIEDKDLHSNPQYNKFYWNNRERYIDLIKKELDYDDRKILTCHGFQNMSCKVLKDFHDNFLEKRNYSYKDIIAIAPYEFTWYNMWLQKREIIPIYAVEPFFKTYHMKSQHIQDYFGGITENDLAREYVGIVVNGNIETGKLLNYLDINMYTKFQENEKISFRQAMLLLKLLIIQPRLYLYTLVKMIRNKIWEKG